MTSLLTRYRRALGAGAAAIALVGGGIGIGVALTGGAAAATGATGHHGRHPCRAASLDRATPATAHRAALRCRAGLGHRFLRGGIHGEVTVKTKSGYATIAFERGQVTAAGGGALTVRAADGTTWTWQLVKDSVVREGRSKVAAGQLAAGEQVLVAGPVVGGSHEVRLVRIRPAS